MLLVCSNFSFIPAVINMHSKSWHGIYSLCFHGNNKTDSSDMEISIYSEKRFLAKLSWIQQLKVEEFNLYIYFILQISFYMYSRTKTFCVLPGLPIISVEVFIVFQFISRIRIQLFCWPLDQYNHIFGCAACGISVSS